MDCLDLCLLVGENLPTSANLDVDPFSVLYRDIIPHAGRTGERKDFGNKPSSVVVSGLPWWCNDMMLERTLTKLGITGVSMVRFHECPINGKSKGSAVIRFHSPLSANECVVKLRSFQNGNETYNCECKHHEVGDGASPPMPIKQPPVILSTPTPVAAVHVPASAGQPAESLSIKDFESRKQELIRKAMQQLTEKKRGAPGASPSTKRQK
eukprot:TRINITY_DN10699_c0_g1_i1.p1 TRINITY_DN10699_c0_g1~~TRINITY_DN10699_c0_g1_i1.p1  ORF type:complete len:225 (+),score=37.33 TRINITY_DN10699_c0_g1_i1:47-676(+)